MIPDPDTALSRSIARARTARRRAFARTILIAVIAATTIVWLAWVIAR